MSGKVVDLRTPGCPASIRRHLARGLKNRRDDGRKVDRAEVGGPAVR